MLVNQKEKPKTQKINKLPILDLSPACSTWIRMSYQNQIQMWLPSYNSRSIGFCSVTIAATAQIHSTYVCLDLTIITEY